MKITLSDEHTRVLLAALEAYERFKINQPKTALEQIFPKEYWELGWDKMNQLCRPIQAAFFPNHPHNGGPGICSEEAGDARIAYEIQKTIQQYLALQKSGGWFGHTVDFDGSFLNPSGLPPPEIEGLEEMQYKDYEIPLSFEDKAIDLYDRKQWETLWGKINEWMPDLPRGDKKEIILGPLKKSGFDSNSDYLFVRVHKPRKS